MTTDFTRRFREITYPCKADHSKQGAMIFTAEGRCPRPLAVALHTWSYSFRHPSAMEFATICARRNWNLIFPDFRGPNTRPEACGSELVVSDLEDAVSHMKSVFLIDPDRIYLTGGSGGGYATLLAAGRRPGLWAAASAWCPISDLAAWHAECAGVERFRHYAGHIEAACGGDPRTDPAARKEAVRRSALPTLAEAKELPLDISTGIHDGHRGSVPVSHALRAYNVLAAPEDRFTPEEIDFLVRTETVPPHLAATETEPSYGTHKLLLRRRSNRVRLNLFEGAHDMLNEAAFSWLARQKRGSEPDWRPNEAAGSEGAEALSH